MKKTYALILALCFVSTSLFAQNENNFEIKFNIKGVNPTGIYVTFFGEKNIASNEQIVPDNGEFVFKGKTLAPVVTRLSFSGETRFLKMVGNGYIPYKSSSLWLIVYPGAAFNVTGTLEGKDFIDLYPQDKGENSVLAQLTKKLMPLTNSMGNAARELQVNKSLDDNKKRDLEQSIVNYQNKIEEVKIDFLKEYSNSIAALWLMEDMLIRSEIKPDYLIPMMNNVDVEKYGENYFYKSVKSRLDGSANTTVGKICPEISSDSSADGSIVSLSALRGKYVIIDFWGTWCGPCMSGVPHMKAFRNKYAERLQILGISNDKDFAKWKAVIDKNEMNWPNILIGSGEKDYVAKFNVQGFPTKILVSPDGVILHRESGESDAFYSVVEKIITK